MPCPKLKALVLIIKRADPPWLPRQSESRIVCKHCKTRRVQTRFQRSKNSETSEKVVSMKRVTWMGQSSWNARNYPTLAFYGQGMLPPRLHWQDGSKIKSPFELGARVFRVDQRSCMKRGLWQSQAKHPRPAKAASPTRKAFAPSPGHLPARREACQVVARCRRYSHCWFDGCCIFAGQEYFANSCGQMHARHTNEATRDMETERHPTQSQKISCFAFH